MQLDTRHFGMIEVDEKGIVNFQDGLPGFEHEKKFILLASPDEQSPFQWMQCVDNPDLAFVVIDPRTFKPDYDIDVEDEEVAYLDVKDANRVLVYSIVVVPEDLTKITANLKAPVLINMENNRGKQVVLNQGEYKTQHFIMEELQKTGGQE